MDSGIEEIDRPTAATGTTPVQEDVAVPAQRRVPADESVTACTGPGGASEAETRPLDVVPPVDATQLPDPCRCSHGREAHEHFRGGTDCSACDCGRYRRPGLLRRARPSAGPSTSPRSSSW